MKTILFITGTRADYGKIKPLIKAVEVEKKFTTRVFVTGMHMLSKYGSTFEQLDNDGIRNLFKFINQSKSTLPEMILANTISGLSNFINEFEIDLIVVHGDRIEALAGAIVGALNNIRVLHIEGGEVSGTIDESIRHAISKFSHVHMVANDESLNRLVKMGEDLENIHVIGSPDIDIMLSDGLPSLEIVKDRYDISFNEYSILIFHPVTTEYNEFEDITNELLKFINSTNLNLIIIYPNNDLGSNIILDKYNRLKRPNIKLIPSMRFEYFLTLLKNCQIIIGNSSSGIREAEVYGKAAVNIGSRQNGRNKNSKNIVDSNYTAKSIDNSVNLALKIQVTSEKTFGDGKSAEKFLELMNNGKVLNCPIQKIFVESD